MQQREAVVFWAQSVALHMQRQGLAKVLPLDLPIDQPPVGTITLRSRERSPSCDQLMDCLRRAAGR